LLPQPAPPHLEWVLEGLNQVGAEDDVEEDGHVLAEVEHELSHVVQEQEGVEVVLEEEVEGGLIEHLVDVGVAEKVDGGGHPVLDEGVPQESALVQTDGANEQRRVLSEFLVFDNSDDYGDQTEE